MLIGYLPLGGPVTCNFLSGVTVIMAGPHWITKPIILSVIRNSARAGAGAAVNSNTAMHVSVISLPDLVIAALHVRIAFGQTLSSRSLQPLSVLFPSALGYGC